MSRPGRLHLNAFLMGVSQHEAARRLPEVDPFAHVDVAHYQNLARIAERGRLARPANRNTRTAAVVS